MPYKRIGHKGADTIAPGNTVQSFDAALAQGVDMVEFDVLPEHIDGTGELFLAHDYTDLAARRASVLTLEDGLAHFAQDAWAGVDLDVDLKVPGCEDRVVEALHRHGLARRGLVSTMERVSLERIRALDPAVRLGLSVPRVRRDYLANRLTKGPALCALLYARRVLPGRLARSLARGEFEAVMAHWALVTPRFAREVLSAGGELYVWTVDDAKRIAALSGLGVTGIISNDPRLFEPAAA
jgi:glycerophosphoryl diester phosphodiesterase